MSYLIFLCGIYINKVWQNLEWYKNVLLTFDNHVGDSIQIVVGEIKEEG